MERYANILKTLGHIDRLRIVATLQRGELTITELVQTLDMSQPRVTQFIKSLEAAEVVERHREGSWVFSRLRRDNSDVSKLVQDVLSKLPTDNEVLKTDLKRLAETISNWVMNIFPKKILRPRYYPLSGSKVSTL